MWLLKQINVQHLIFITRNSKLTVAAIENKPIYEEVERFLMLAIDRLYNGTKALRPLYKKFKNDHSFEYSIGLILRTILSDYLIVMAMHAKMGNIVKNNSDGKKSEYELDVEIKRELNTLCNRYNHDGVNKEKENIKEQILSNEINLKEGQTKYTNLVNMFPECFETYKHDGSEPQTIKAYKQILNMKNEIFKDIRNAEGLEKILPAIQLHEQFSKYAHFGALYSFYNNREPKLKYQDIYEVTIHLLLYNYYLCSLLQETFTDIPELKLRTQRAKKYYNDIVKSSRRP